MKTQTLRNVLTGTLAASLMIGATAVHAEFVDQIYHTDFSGYNEGDIPTDWRIDDGDDWGIEADNGNYAYAFRNTTSGVSVFDGTLNGTAAANLHDLRVVMPMSLASDTQGGMVMRYQDTNNFYLIRHRKDETNDRLQIATRIGGSWAELDGVDGGGSFPTDGVLDVTVEGFEITVHYFANLGDNQPVVTLNATDHQEAFNSGTFGVRTSTDDFVVHEVTAYVPEPGSLALLGAGAGLMLIRRRR